MNSKFPDYVRESDLILGMLPFSHATLWRLVKKSQFPKPIKLSERITAWERSAVVAWLKTKSEVAKGGE